MEVNDFFSKKEILIKYISDGRLYEAFSLLKKMSERKLMWEITDRIAAIENSYRYMLRYAIDGVDDPHRDVIYRNIVDELNVIYKLILRKERSLSDPSVYYVPLRMQTVKPVQSAIDEFHKVLRGNDAFAQASGNAASPQVIEKAENALFESIWITYPYSEDDARAIMRLIDDVSVPSHVKSLIVSALMLAPAEYFDQRRIEILADIYSSDDADETLQMTALTAMMILLYLNRRQSLSPSVKARIEALRDVPSWQSDIKSVYLELIRTRDTDRIASKLRDEIVPEMIKIKPEIDRRIREDFPQGIDPMELEENPEWAEFLDKTGIADKMKELSEIQEEGGDVLMATFSQLKSFPFFHYPANWFMPFHPECSAVTQLGADSDLVAEIVSQSFFMCDSDKYSFVLAFASMPEAQRNMLMSQIKGQNINAAELRSSSLNLSTDSRRAVVNKYVQNLYRFYKLFRRKEDFDNPFANEINLTEIKPLQADFLDDSMLQLVAEFYFKHGYYKEALGVFKLRESHIFPDATLYQKIGYCLHKLDDPVGAIRYYEQAEMLDGGSLWTLRRIASAFKQIGDYKQALEYYKRIDALQPDKMACVMNIGQCQMALGMYSDAVKSFFRAEYLDETSQKPLRPLAWSLLMSGDLDGAVRLYDRLLSEAPRAVDYLNRGHAALAQKKYRDAVKFYQHFLAVAPGGWNDFVNEMDSDRSSLERIGVDVTILPLVIDSVRYMKDGF